MHSLFTFYFYEFGHVLWQLVGDNKVNDSVFCRKRKKKLTIQDYICAWHSLNVIVVGCRK